MTTPSPPRQVRRLDQVGRWIVRKLPPHGLTKFMVVVYCLWASRRLDFFSGFENFAALEVETPTTTSTTTSLPEQMLPSDAATYNLDAVDLAHNDQQSIAAPLSDAVEPNNNVPKVLSSRLGLDLLLVPATISSPSSSIGVVTTETACRGDDVLIVDHPQLVKSHEYRDQPHYAHRNYTQQYLDAGYVDPSKLLLVLPRYYNNNNSNNNNPTTTTTWWVPCRFHPKVTVKLQHFAHSMEQLYMCIDHWLTVKEYAKSNNNNNNRTIVVPVLLYDQETQAKPWQQGLQTTPFLQGIVQVLKSQLGLEQRTTQEFLMEHPQFNNTTNTTLLMPYFRDVQNGYLLQHAKLWNTIVQQEHFSQQHEAFKNTLESVSAAANQTADQCCFLPPRIKILSRHTTRSIANAKAIAQQLSLLEYRYHPEGTNRTTDTTTNTPTQHRLPKVTVHFLEGTTFQEQVEFFQSVDIVISGHGAQLTGLPFMADNSGGSSSSSKSCKQVVELYPKHYALPYYFGSLTHQAGMAHSYMYMTDNQTDIVLPWEIRNGATYQERFQARKAKLCPRPDAMVEAVVELIHDWHTCTCPQKSY